MISAIINVIIAIIINNIALGHTLKKCLVVDSSTNIELFEYGGKVYDKNKFIQLKTKTLKRAISKRYLEENLEKYESGLFESKTPDLDMAIIEAYKNAIRDRDI